MIPRGLPFFAVEMVTPDAGSRPRGPLLARLLEASRDADAAEAALAEARARYGREPSPAGLEKIREASLDALQKELRFEAIWKGAAQDLLAGEREG